MFEKSHYDEETFNRIDFQHQLLSGLEFIDCKFIECNFSETEFKNCNFKGCTFTNSDLSLIKVEKSVFKDIEIRDSKVIGIIWSTARLGGKEGFQLFKAIDFINCVLNYSSFAGLDLENIKMEKCIAKEVDFSEANFKKANFKGTDFEGSIFRNTNLEKANFVGASNYSISPVVNNISQAKFSMPEVTALLYSMDIIIEDLIENE